MAERIGDRGEIAEPVVGIGCAVAKCINGSRTLTTIVVFCMSCIATTIGLRNLTTKRVVRDGVGNGGDRDIHQ